MKKSHIFIIFIISMAIAIIVATADDASVYATFGDAYQMASAGNTSSIHVVGELTKGTHGNAIGIEESADKVSFTFVLIDDNQKQQRVQYNQPMPADFTKSEKVVVVGHYQGDVFLAEKILLKCPSKYQEEGAIARGA
jgi:cytochrome c-type biogenesis protein CcmE